MTESGANSPAASRRRLTRVALSVVVVALLAAAGFTLGTAAAPGDATLSVWPSPQGRVALAPAGHDAVTETLAVTTCDNLSANPATVDPCRVLYPAGSTVELTAAPQPGYTFHHWSAADCSTAPTCAVTLPQAGETASAFAFFSPAALTVIISGAGTVTGANGAINCTDGSDIGCVASLPVGTPVTLTAQSAEAIHWVFGCLPAGEDSSSPTCEALPEDFFVGVRFGSGDDPVPPFGVSVDLRVAKSGTGSGQVTGSGIDCGATCVARNLRFGTLMTLEATASPGSAFDRWIGVCGTNARCRFNAGPISSLRAVFRDLKERLLSGRITRMRIVSTRPYRVRVWIRSSTRARAQLVVRRGRSIYGRGAAVLRAGVSSVSATLSRRARPGKASVVVVLRDADGHSVTLRADLRLGK